MTLVASASSSFVSERSCSAARLFLSVLSKRDLVEIRDDRLIRSKKGSKVPPGFLKSVPRSTSLPLGDNEGVLSD